MDVNGLFLKSVSDFFRGQLNVWVERSTIVVVGRDASIDSTIRASIEVEHSADDMPMADPICD